MLALGALDMILAEDYQHVWLDNLSSKGYIQHIVDSLLVDNDQLRDLLLPRPEPLRALYIFQSKIVSIDHNKFQIVNIWIVYNSQSVAMSCKYSCKYLCKYPIYQPTPVFYILVPADEN